MSASTPSRYGVFLRVVTELYIEVDAKSKSAAEKTVYDQWFEKGDREFVFRSCEPSVDLVRKIKPETA